MRREHQPNHVLQWVRKIVAGDIQAAAVKPFVVSVMGTTGTGKSSLINALFGTDLKTGRLPNVVTIPGVVVGFLYSLGLPPGIRDSVLGAALGGGMLRLVRWGWKQSKGVEGMGLGDV